MFFHPEFEPLIVVAARGSPHCLDIYFGALYFEILDAIVAVVAKEHGLRDSTQVEVCHLLSFVSSLEEGSSQSCRFGNRMHPSPHCLDICFDGRIILACFCKRARSSSIPFVLCSSDLHLYPDSSF